MSATPLCAVSYKPGKAGRGGGLYLPRLTEARQSRLQPCFVTLITSASVFQPFQIKALLKVFQLILLPVKIIQCTVSLNEIVNKRSYKTLLNISCTQLILVVKHACLSLKSLIHPLQSLDLRHLLGKPSDPW